MCSKCTPGASSYTVRTSSVAEKSLYLALTTNHCSILYSSHTQLPVGVVVLLTMANLRSHRSVGTERVYLQNQGSEYLEGWRMSIWLTCSLEWKKRDWNIFARGVTINFDTCNYNGKRHSSQILMLN